MERSGGNGMEELIKALHRQADAIDRLVASNQALIATMIEAEGVEDELPKTFLDGTPCR
jgi:hypothetical protein